jgi:hypothetical protein
MQTVNFWNKLNLHRGKAFVALLFCILMSLGAQAQRERYKQVFNPNYDNKKFSYGFLLQVQSSSYQIEYSDIFVSDSFDSAYAINPRWSTGFSLGFLINFRLERYFDLRITPTVAFQEYKVDYEFVSEPTDNQLISSTSVDLPILLKYKSVRRGNARMYFVGGLKPGFQVSSKNPDEEVSDDFLITKDFNLSGEIGVGVDVYYPLFKFSPELRYSRGLLNILGNETNSYGVGIDRLNTHTVSLILFFQ